MKNSKTTSSLSPLELYRRKRFSNVALSYAEQYLGRDELQRLLANASRESKATGS